MTYESFAKKIIAQDESITRKDLTKFTLKLLSIFIFVTAILVILCMECISIPLYIIAMICMCFLFVFLFSYMAESIDVFYKVRDISKKYIVIDIISLILIGIIKLLV